MAQKFSKREAIKFGWETAKKNLKFFFLVLIFVWGVSFGLGFLAKLIKKPNCVICLFLRVAQWVFSIIFSLGLIKISLDFCDGKLPHFSEIFSQYRLFFRYTFATLIYIFFLIFGTILFVVPGIVFAIRSSFYSYFIVDKNSRILESLKRSWKIAKGNTFNLFLFFLLLELINLLGFLALAIGSFWTVPTTSVARAFVYRKLLSFSQTKV